MLARTVDVVKPTLATLAMLVACGMPDEPYFGRVDRLEPGHFRWCNSGEPDFLDPARASSTTSAPVITALFDGLTTYGMDGLPVPSLATHWEVDEALRIWTFHLRHGARWSNGREVTAYDVAFAAMRVVHPLTGSPNSDNLAPLENATGYLTRKTLAVRATGEVVTVVDDALPDLAARTASAPLALRDLGAAVDASYARVPAGATVTLIATSGTTISPPAPDGRPWAYVFWPRDVEGVFGWIPARELTGEPNGDVEAHVTRADGTPATLHGRDLAHAPEVLGIRVVDPYTIVFTCKDPTPFFLAATDNRALRTTPTEAVSRWPNAWTRPEHVITSGPMHLVAWHERDRLELVRSPTYWNPTEVTVDRITVLSMDDQAANANTYYTGGCDATAANNVPASYLPVLAGETRGRAYRDYSVSPYLGIYFLWINTEKLTDRHLRRALALAVDRTQVPRFTHGSEIPSAQLTPGTPIAQLSPADRAACGVTATTPGIALVMIAGALCYVPPPGLDFDLARARAEVALARAAGGVPAKLRYIYNAGSEAHKQIAEYLQASWAAIGLDVELEAQEWNAMLEATKQGDYEIARLGNLGNVADTESEFLPLFRCHTPDNRGRYCNPAYDQLMDEARTIHDRPARNAKLRAAEALMIEDAPVIPIYVYTQKQLVKPYVKNYAINVIAHPPLWRVAIDPAWNTRPAP
ncbi:MAG: peptide ABC transporter substrate-binding protein [Proteobacteria bacterium]|nr:peptide ABC transporter substrate-binding protein [Pseudomonadota bacterium]